MTIIGSTFPEDNERRVASPSIRRAAWAVYGRHAPHYISKYEDYSISQGDLHNLLRAEAKLSDISTGTHEEAIHKDWMTSDPVSVESLSPEDRDKIEGKMLPPLVEPSLAVQFELAKVTRDIDKMAFNSEAFDYMRGWLLTSLRENLFLKAQLRNLINEWPKG